MKTERLNAELEAYKEEADYSMIKHPLVYAVPFLDQPDEIARLNKMLEGKKEAVEKARDNHEWNTFVFLHERPYRVTALAEVHENLTDRDYWLLLREVWCDSENIFQHSMVWWELLTAPRHRKVLFTSTRDRGALEKMPEILHIYRGTQQVETEGHYLGYSWTLDEEKAKWFARRFPHRTSGGAPVIASADVLKKYVVGYIDIRGEQEIVVEPKELRNLEWELV